MTKGDIPTVTQIRKISDLILNPGFVSVASPKMNRRTRRHDDRYES